MGSGEFDRLEPRLESMSESTRLGYHGYGDGMPGLVPPYGGGGGGGGGGDGGMLWLPMDTEWGTGLVR